MPLILTRAKLRPGYQYCTNCKGFGYKSEYDEGWRSLSHSRELAAPRECMFCYGTGLRKIT